MRFKTLLDAWSKEPPTATTEERYAIHLTVEDAARIAALKDLFPGHDEERLIADMLSAALDEIQAAMPYVPGERVIREDDFGDPVYEDVGLTPRFLELVRQHRERHAGGKP